MSKTTSSTIGVTIWLFWCVVSFMLLFTLDDNDTQEQQIKTLQAMVDTQEQQIKTLQAMVTRDDKIIKSLMGPEGWDRSKFVYGRSYTISNDSIVWAFTQNPSDDKYYELSF